jgi:hypothetical protein
MDTNKGGIYAIEKYSIYIDAPLNAYNSIPRNFEGRIEAESSKLRPKQKHHVKSQLSRMRRVLLPAQAASKAFSQDILTPTCAQTQQT